MQLINLIGWCIRDLFGEFTYGKYLLLTVLAMIASIAYGLNIDKTIGIYLMTAVVLQFFAMNILIGVLVGRLMWKSRR